MTALDRVVLDAREVLVPVAFRPLEELEVVLHFAFYEGFDGDGAFDCVAGETVCWVVKISFWGCWGEKHGAVGRKIGWDVGGRRTLEDFEVLDVGVFGVDVELYSRHGHVHC